MLTKADITLIRSLSDKRVRVETGLFVVEGRKMVEEALASDFEVRRVLGLPEYGGIACCESVTSKELERMSHLKTPPGVLALVEIPRWRLPDNPGRELALALDDVQDPGNLGTILRLCDWFGIRDVYCSPATADCFNPKVVQATMGAVFRVRVHYGELPPLLSGVAGKGWPVYGTFLEGENLYTADLAGSPVATTSTERREEMAPGGILVMGNEGNGISAAVAAAVTRKLYIPPYPVGTPTGESLNVAVATAILCAEFRRRSMIQK